MDTGTTMSRKKEKTDVVPRESVSVCLQDPLCIEDTGLHIKQDPELELDADGSEHHFVEHPLAVSWSTDLIEEVLEQGLEVDDTENVYPLTWIITQTHQEQFYISCVCNKHIVPEPVLTQFEKLCTLKCHASKGYPILLNVREVVTLVLSFSTHCRNSIGTFSYGKKYISVRLHRGCCILLERTIIKSSQKENNH